MLNYNVKSQIEEDMLLLPVVQELIADQIITEKRALAIRDPQIRRLTENCALLKNKSIKLIEFLEKNNISFDAFINITSEDIEKILQVEFTKNQLEIMNKKASVIEKFYSYNSAWSKSHEIIAHRKISQEIF